MSECEREELKAWLALKPETCREEIARTFLSVPWETEPQWLSNYQVQWSHPYDYERLLTGELSPNVSRLEFVRSGLDGHIIGYSETMEAQNVDAGSLQRPVGDTANFVRGTTAQAPFLPGGMEASAEEPEAEDTDEEFLTVPPDFTRGLSVQRKDDDTQAATIDAGEDTGEHMYLMSDDSLYRMSNTAPVRREGDAILDEILPAETVPSFFAAEQEDKLDEKRSWAHIILTTSQMTNFHELVPDMAIDYPFELDTFQKQAVYHLEQNDSVFVAAHTSAGKTVVAEYAIALAMKHLSRCIYTSPIKALSNQKFREFKHKFGAGNVGILTGDVQINAEAPCLIMTTEILRSMLYRGADLIRDVEFVVFDEVHYVNDQERGVVWEEVIILLPAHVNIVLLSATVPNTKEFADWVGRTKKKDVYVISTTKRPVPLEHFLYVDKDVFRVVDADRHFLPNGVTRASAALTRRQDRDGPVAGRGARGARGGGRGGFAPRHTDVAGDKSLWVHLVGTLKKKSLLPVVVFVFSKRKCEEYADTLSGTDLSTAKEKSEVHVTIERSLTRLKDTDRTLPQIVRVQDMLLRGIGVHHSGLLPIMKELVEIMFQRGLVKVLFATETFAMGVNMPARSVVFSGIRKHDGHNFRWLLPGEYTQMSGRAGRRGLDKTGVVIVVATPESCDMNLLNRMMLGQSTKLRSQFRVTYSMVLNLLRVETLRVEDMIKRSFSENTTQRLLPAQQQRLDNVNRSIQKLQPGLAQSKLGADTLEDFYDANFTALQQNSNMLAIVAHHAQGSRIFCVGRFVLLRTSNNDWSPALIVQPMPHQVCVLIGRVHEESGDQSPLWLTAARVRAYEPDRLMAEIRTLLISGIAFVTRHIVDIHPGKVYSKQPAATREALTGMKRVLAEMKNDLLAHGDVARGLLLHEADMSRMQRLDFQEAREGRNVMVERIANAQNLVDESTFASEYAAVTKIRRLELEAMRIHNNMSDENLELIPEYHQRMEVLKTLRFVDPETDSILLKGRVACEIKSVAELVLTDLVLDNMFNDYEPEEVVALLSSLVFREKTQREPRLTERLTQGLNRIAVTVEQIGEVQLAHQVNFDEEAEGLHTGLVEVVYEWALGTDFRQIMDLTDVGEGTIVRTITRLDETLRDLRDAARVIGDMDLFDKMQRCQQLIRRDIVFAASLYF